MLNNWLSVWYVCINQVQSIKNDLLYHLPSNSLLPTDCLTLRCSLESVQNVMSNPSTKPTYYFWKQSLKAQNEDNQTNFLLTTALKGLVFKLFSDNFDNRK